MGVSKVQVGAKLSVKKKQMLDDSGYNARQAIEFFLKEYYSRNPNKKLFEEHEILTKEIEVLEKNKRNIIVDLESKKTELEVVKEKLGYNYISESDRMDQVINGHLKDIQERYDEKKDFIGSVFDLEENLFIVKANACGMPLDEFKELVEGYIQ